MTIAEKIAQIIAKAQSTDSANEAETLMSKVHELLEKHGLEISDVASLDTSDPVGTTLKAHSGYASEAWVAPLGYSAAEYFGCCGIRGDEKNHIFMHAVGRESARVTFVLMMPYLVKEVRRQAKLAFDNEEFKSVSRAKTAIGNALALRIHKLNYDARKAQRQRMSVSTFNALVPMDAISAEIKAAFSSLEMIPRNLNTNLTQEAVTRAGSISLHKQTTAAGVLTLADFRGAPNECMS